MFLIIGIFRVRFFYSSIFRKSLSFIFIRLKIPYYCCSKYQNNMEKIRMIRKNKYIFIKNFELMTLN